MSSSSVISSAASSMSGATSTSGSSSSSPSSSSSSVAADLSLDIPADPLKRLGALHNSEVLRAFAQSPASSACSVTLLQVEGKKTVPQLPRSADKDSVLLLQCIAFCVGTPPHLLPFFFSSHTHACFFCFFFAQDKQLIAESAWGAVEERGISWALSGLDEVDQRVRSHLESRASRIPGPYSFASACVRPLLFCCCSL